MGEARTFSVDGVSVNVTNPEKVLYPGAGFTKTDVASYYEAIAETMLPHVRRRPLTLHRFPNGVEQAGFYEKRCPPSAPPFVNVITNSLSRKTLEQCTADNAATLIWLANLGSLEIHTGLSAGPELDVPRKMTFDLDPGAPAAIVECCQVAIVLRDLFAQLGLRAFPKTSGSKGLHVDVPLNTDVTFRQTRDFANAVAVLLQNSRPDLIVADMTKAIRGGKVLIDWSQNDRSKTTVAPYSLRARPRPWVSTPLQWDEIEATTQADPSSDPLRFEASDVLHRVENHGDIYAEVATFQQRLPELSA